jgi:anti-anti-sigma factor
MNAVMERLIVVERQGDTLVLTAKRDLRELEFQQIGEEQEEVLHRLTSDPSLLNVVVDFDRTDYFGSSAVGMFTRLWKLVRGRGGRMAFCNLSPHEEDILGAVGLIGLWPIYTSRAVAIQAVTG